ncbi:MAG TPA: RagB/SusD family nutrient uptake outer membrane protein [Flavitalea sp.]|nr:RagB/SusD family nutrient uptake outer membrane protein [Flavitalea sp.]HMG09601.1 RagB/SusD family nutrient uptake outer membrane protein [Mucilaginibacter sp.]
MKHIIKYIIVFILIVTLFAGCKKDNFLTRDNPSATTDAQFWQTQEQLSGYLDQIYTNSIPSASLSNYGAPWQNAHMDMSGITDEVVYRSNYSDWQNFVNGTATSSIDIANTLYAQNYRDIRNACRILENYKRIYIQDTVLRERYAAETRALRAYAHLKLFQFYGPIPIVTTSLTVSAAQNTPRNTQEEDVNFISTELDAAATLLPATYNSSDVKRITKGACYAMQVELYLVVKNYPKVIEYAQKLIGLNVYRLYTSSTPGANSYSELFGYNALLNNEEVLINPQGANQVFFRYGPASAGSQAVLSPTAALVNTYETRQGKTLQELGNDSLMTYWKNPLYHNNRDPRLAASILCPGQTFVGRLLNPFNTSGTDAIGKPQSTFTGFWCRKYLDSTDVSRNTTGNLNFMVIRYPEILLSYVEALVESGDWSNPDIKRYLNMIRNRAGMPNYDETVYNTQDKIRELYRRERMVELAFEGTRLFDIRRWGIGGQVLNGPAQGVINPATGQPVTAETRTFNANRDNLWPIPLTEINDNNAMKQNPNW